MRKRRKSGGGKTILIVIASMALLSLGGFGTYRFIRHEQSQDELIRALQETIARLSNEVEDLSSKIDSLPAKNAEWLSEGYNYLAIGNSITLHNITSYWWNEIGMAASDADHDYYHQVLRHLGKTNKAVKGIPYNFAIWETQNHDRDETLEQLDPLLDPNLDLVTVQLAENATELTTFREDYTFLLKYIRAKAPAAKILVVGDFWTYGNRDQMKREAVEMAKVEYVSLDGVTDNPKYQCGIGTKVFDAEGHEHTVEHPGVAIHPGDQGMLAIAERIISAL